MNKNRNRLFAIKYSARKWGRRAFVVMVLLVARTPVIASDDTDWNRFRGPNGCGVADAVNLPTEFGPDKNLIWRIDLPTGYSSPVIAHGKIFVTAVVDEQLFTICLKQATGEELWRQEAPRDRKEPLDPHNNPASPSPVVDDSGVYVFFPDFGLIAYSLDGQLKWKHPLGPFTNLYGMGASPILIDGKVILVCDQNVDSFIIALNAADGEVAWKTPRPEATSGHCTPIVHRLPSGQSEIIAVGSFFLTAYNPDTGEKVWWVGGLSFEMKSTPVLGSDDLVFINGYGSPMNQLESNYQIEDFEKVVAAKDADGDGLLCANEMPDELAKNFFSAVDLNADGKLDRKEWDYYRESVASKNSLAAIRLGGHGDMSGENVVWKYFRNIPQLPSPLVYNNLLYMVTDQGIVTCLDPATGQDLKRARLKGVSGSIYASPVAADGKLFFVNESGKVAVARADAEFDVLQVNDLGERCYATPAFDHNRIYIRTVNSLFAFGRR